MADEVNPMAELGFSYDNQTLMEAQGLIFPGNATRDLCAAMLPNGAKFYDLVDRYANVITYILNRDDPSSINDSCKMVAPFLKAFGVTDQVAMNFYRSHITCREGSDLLIDHLVNTMPVFVNSRMYEPAARTLMEKFRFPLDDVSSSSLDLDEINMSGEERHNLRRLCVEMGQLELPTEKYELNVPIRLSRPEMELITYFDTVFGKHFLNTSAQQMMQNMDSVGPNEKAYSLLDIRKETLVDVDGTIYIGGDTADYQVMDLIRGGEGLSMSFNGGEFAVHGSNVAVISEDCTAVAVLVSKFYDTGIEGVYDLIEHWNRKDLESMDFPNPGLIDIMLERHPTDLPEVYRVNRDNVVEIARRSENVRNKEVQDSTSKVQACS